MSKWIAEFDLEDGDTMPEHMDLEYRGLRIDFHCKPLEQEPCEDAVSRNAITKTLNEMDRYIADELTLCGSDNKFPKNEVFIVDDVYEQIVEQLSSVTDKMCFTKDIQLKPLPKERREWIPVSERLPEESLNSVIGWDAYRERCVFVQFIQEHWQITGSDESFDIQAWMPLPAPYKAEKG